MNQSFQNFELIIVNDGSTDNSLEVVHGFSDARIKVIDQDNTGVSTARNNGAMAAKFEYIAFLDADDWWCPHYLEEMYSLINRYPDAGLWAAKYYKVKHGKNIEADIGLEEGLTEGYINYFKVYANTMWMPVTSSSFIIRKSVFQELKGFKPELKIGEDFDLWARVALKYKYAYLNKPLVFYNQDVEVQDRAVGGQKIYKPENHYIFNLGYLKGQEKANPGLKNLLDKLRLRALFRYHLKGVYLNETKQLVNEINFLEQPLSWRLKYKLPVWMVRAWYYLKLYGSTLKTNIRKFKKTPGLKTAFLLGSLNRGGTETLLLDTFRNIGQEEINIVCIYRIRGMLYEDFRQTGIRLFQISPKGKFDISYIFKLRRFLKNNNIEIAHAQQPLDALYAWLACIGLKTKVLFTMHGYDFRYGKLTRKIISFVHKHTNLNIFVSKAQRDYFIEKYRFRKEKTRVLYNGVSFDKFNDFQHTSIKQEFDIPENRLLLGSVGNFNPARDQITICRFLNLLNLHNVDFTFIFAGSQSKAAPWYWDDCRNYCTEHGLQPKVIFAGLRNDIPNFLSQLDAFVYSTDHDTFGIAVIEAMYMGIPVFINNWKVFEEITDGGKHANLYQSGNENDLLEKLLLFYENMDEYAGKAKTDAAWVKEQYSIQNHIKNLLEIYRSAIAGKAIR